MAKIIPITEHFQSHAINILILAEAESLKTMPLVFMTRGERIARSWEFYPGALTSQFSLIDGQRAAASRCYLLNEAAITGCDVPS